MQRTYRSGTFERRIKIVRFLKRPRVQRNDAVDGRTLLVERIDPIQIRLHQLMCSELAGFHRCTYLVDRLLHDLKRNSRLLNLTWPGRRGGQHQSDTDQNDKCLYSQSGRFLRRAAAAQDILDGMVSFLAGILKNAVVRIAG